MVFPFLAQESRGVRVREAELDTLAEAVTPRTSLVAVSAVQSADGRLADLDALEAAASATGAKVLLDTHPGRRLAARRRRPLRLHGLRGLQVAAGPARHLLLHGAAGSREHAAAAYGRLVRRCLAVGQHLRRAAATGAHDARRFDVSPAWHSWVGQAASLDLLSAVGSDALHEHALGLANRFRAAARPPRRRTRRSSACRCSRAARSGSTRAGVAASVRAGRLRLSFHVNNTMDDVERVVAALTERGNAP